MGTLRIEIEAPAERVWEALTSQEALRDWFNMSTEIEPREGGRFRFEGTRGDRVFLFDGTVETMRPPEQITLRLQSPDGQSVTLRFSLQQGSDSTAVELQHDGFDGQTNHDLPFWDGDELIPLREYVCGIGPTY